MKTTEARSNLLALALLAGIPWRIERIDGKQTGSRCLSNWDLRLIFEKQCPCSKTEDCGFNCSGNDLTRTGYSSTRLFSVICGTQPQYCYGSGTGQCQSSGPITPQTVTLCKTTAYDGKKCGSDEACGPGSESDQCAISSNGDSYPVRRTTQVCDSS